MNGVNNNTRTINGINNFYSDSIQTNISTSVLYTGSDGIITGTDYNNLTGALFNDANVLNFRLVKSTDIDYDLTANKVCVSDANGLLTTTNMTDATIDLFNSNFTLLSNKITANQNLYLSYLYNSLTDINIYNTAGSTIFTNDVGDIKFILSSLGVFRVYVNGTTTPELNVQDGLVQINGTLLNNSFKSNGNNVMTFKRYSDNTTQFVLDVLTGYTGGKIPYMNTSTKYLTESNWTISADAISNSNSNANLSLGSGYVKVGTYLKYADSSFEIVNNNNSLTSIKITTANSKFFLFDTINATTSFIIRPGYDDINATNGAITFECDYGTSTTEYFVFNSIVKLYKDFYITNLTGNYPLYIDTSTKKLSENTTTSITTLNSFDARITTNTTNIATNTTDITALDARVDTLEATQYFDRNYNSTDLIYCITPKTSTDSIQCSSFINYGLLSIGTMSENNLYLKTNKVAKYYIDPNGNFLPWTTNTTGKMSVNFINPTNLTNGYVSYYDSTSAYLKSSTITYDMFYIDSLDPSLIAAKSGMNFIANYIYSANDIIATGDVYASTNFYNNSYALTRNLLVTDALQSIKQSVWTVTNDAYQSISGTGNFSTSGNLAATLFTGTFKNTAWTTRKLLYSDASGNVNQSNWTEINDGASSLSGSGNITTTSTITCYNLLSTISTISGTATIGTINTNTIYAPATGTTWLQIGTQAAANLYFKINSTTKMTLDSTGVLKLDYLGTATTNQTYLLGSDSSKFVQQNTNWYLDSNSDLITTKNITCGTITATTVNHVYFKSIKYSESSYATCSSTSESVLDIDLSATNIQDASSTFTHLSNKIQITVVGTYEFNIDCSLYMYASYAGIFLNACYGDQVSYTTDHINSARTSQTANQSDNISLSGFVVITSSNVNNYFYITKKGENSASIRFYGINYSIKKIA